MELKKKRAGGDEDSPATTTAKAELRRCAAALVLPYLSPSALAAAALTCKHLASAALAIASSRASDAARGLEPQPIPFLNAVDARRYSYFLYTPTSVLPASAPASQPWGPESEPRPLRPCTKSASFLVLSGCGCEGLCSTGDDGDCPCLSECGEDCGCGVDCGNRRTQGGIAVRLKIVMGRDKGWGLHAAQLIRKGEFVCEYAGN